MPISPFPKHAAAADRPLTLAGVDEALCLELLVLLEREPQAVVEQVRAWLREDVA